MSKFCFVLCLTAILSGYSGVIDAQPDTTSFETGIYVGSDGASLAYRIYKPANYDTARSYPLVLFLHGAGERGNDNRSQLTWGVSHFVSDSLQQKHPSFVVAPQVPASQTWSGFVGGLKDTVTFSHTMPAVPTPPMRLTIGLLDSLQNRFSIDPGRMYVTGLSMGGFGTWELIERFPNRFAAAVPIAGGGDPSRAFLLKDLPIWAFHGADDAIVNPRFTRTMIDALQIAGGKPGFTEYPGTGHIGAWTKAYGSSALYRWLFSQQRGGSKQAGAEK